MSMNKIKNSTNILLNDPRFVIDNRYYSWGLKNRYISEYKIETIKMSEIKRNYHGEIFSLEQLPFYKYLNGDKIAYKEYFFDNLKRWKEARNEEYVFDPNANCYEHVDNLIKSLEENNYNKKNIIILNFDNIILDGQHRSCWLAYKYGMDYKIDVLKLRFAKKPFSLKSFILNKIIFNLIPIRKYRKILRRKYNA